MAEQVLIMSHKSFGFSDWIKKPFGLFLYTIMVQLTCCWMFSNIRPVASHRPSHLPLSSWDGHIENTDDHSIGETGGNFTGQLQSSYRDQSQLDTNLTNLGGMAKSSALKFGFTALTTSWHHEIQRKGSKHSAEGNPVLFCFSLK